MYWMLVQALAAQSRPQGDLAIAAGVSKQRVSQVVADYDATLQRRQQSAEGWQEPWARRLRAAGAIR